MDSLIFSLISSGKVGNAFLSVATALVLDFVDDEMESNLLNRIIHVYATVEGQLNY